MDKINLGQKLDMIHDFWKPRIAGELNDSYVKLVKLNGEFMWHHHESEDEMFFIIKGRLVIQFRDKNVSLSEGEMIIIPKGVEHCPIAEEEVQVMLLEPKTTLNTGTEENERTAPDEWI
jgi:mannose-6-phosphate isomerase-like protein (cupin superfamily)